MDEITTSFEQILSATLRMVRTSLKAPACFFLQLDDAGKLHVRAADGVARENWGALTLAADKGLAGKCLNQNAIVESGRLEKDDGLAALLNPLMPNTGVKFTMVPVAGQNRTLGIMILGPFPQNLETMPREAELRSAGALCAVLSAHWRLYEWISNFMPAANHDLRTPLTAVQGSIDMVLGGMFGQVGTEVRQMLEMAHKGCERTVRAIEGYLTNKELPKQ